MFTGIIEETGTIDSMTQTGDAIVMKITAKTILSHVELGDSIAVNGVCLTVTSFTDRYFTVDVMPETVKSTSLRLLKTGSAVNLERAVGAGGRFGGHFVTGHVDGVGTIRSKRKVDNAVYYEISIPEGLQPYFIYKGSVAVDGISLTVFGVADDQFTISIIPHTLSETILGSKDVGDIVNIECDLLGKYVEQFVSLRMNGKQTNRSISKSFLEENGFA